MNTAVRTQNVPFLPPAWAAMLKRSALFGAGLMVVMTSACLVLALLSYTPTDPSLNTATDTAPHNTLGLFGAVFADAALQATGLASLAILMTIAAWGARLMRAETVRWLWLRTLAAVAASLLLATGFEMIPAPESWPIAAGFGGSAGQVLLDLGSRHEFLHAIDPMAAEGLRVALALAALAGGAFLTLWAMTLKAAVVGDAFARLGDAALTGLDVAVAKASAMLRRAVTRNADADEDHAVPVKRVRKEPLAIETKFEGQGAPAVEDALDADDDAEEIAHAHAAAFEIDMPARKDVVVPRTKTAKTAKREMAARQGSLLPDSHKGFELPRLDVLTAPPPERIEKVVSREALESNARMLESVLDDFGVKGQITKVRPGPVVTLYELEPAPGTKTSRVVSLADDIARSMSAVAVRIAVVPGRSVIGIELPNAHRETVYLREMLAADDFEKNDGKLVLALGKDIGGAPVFADLARMPHLLVAGTTGSGKSVAINTMIMSLLYRNTPADVRLIMIDPKMLELSVYDGIPHLLAPVVTEPGKAVMALKWVVREMENRYRAMSQLSVRNIAGYNQRLQEAAKKGTVLKRTVQTGFEPTTGKPIYEEQDLDLTPLPYIVVIIDEMADLMLVAGKDVEAAVQRLAQMARAAGIHVIMATQRPSVDVITGTIKANFPTRISFQVTSKIDSRTILGEQGAEQLLGQGDMLYMAAGGRITRVHGPFVSDKEVEEVTGHLREQQEPDYIESVTEEDDLDDVPGFAGLGTGGNTSGGDGLFDQAVAIVARERKASTSFIQRHLSIGYNRAAKIIEDMEQQGMITKANHVGKREVLLPQHGDM
jgi:S-DNA-T family DNA segregation ATPase FtsK/SpoIIIE